MEIINETTTPVEVRIKPGLVRAQRGAWMGKIGDEVVLLPGHHLCGGPRTGMWRENGLRKPREGEAPTHRVVDFSKQYDMVTDSDFTYACLEPLEARS